MEMFGAGFLRLCRMTRHRVVNVDVTVIAEQPKIGPHRDTATSGVLISTAAVGQGKTNEGMGWIGRGEGLAMASQPSLIRRSANDREALLAWFEIAGRGGSQLRLSFRRSRMYSPRSRDTNSRFRKLPRGPRQRLAPIPVFWPATLPRRSCITGSRYGGRIDDLAGAKGRSTSAVASTR